MGCLFLTTTRLHTIAYEKSRINLKLNDLNQEMLDLQNYAATIANNSISMSDMANTPSSMFSRLANFVNWSQMTSRNNTESVFANLSASGQLQTSFGDANQQMAYINSVKNSIFQQQMQSCIQVETKLLNAKETKIQQEINKLQTRLEMLNAEEQSAKSAQQESAQNSAPNYMA